MRSHFYRRSSRPVRFGIGVASFAILALSLVHGKPALPAQPDCSTEFARLGSAPAALEKRAHDLGDTAQKAPNQDPRTYRAASTLFVRVLVTAEAKHLRADCLASTYEDASYMALAGGDAELAVRELRRDLALQPADTPVQDRAEKRAFLGITLGGAGRLEEAAAVERASLALFESEPSPSPDDLASIRFALGTTLFRLGAYDESASTLQSVAKIEPSAAPAVFALTVASAPLRAAGRTAESDASLDAALALETANPDPSRKAFVLLWRAQYRLQDERYLDAERDLDAVMAGATDASPQSTALRGAAQGFLASAYLMESRVADSQAAFDRARMEYAKLPPSAGTLPLAATDESQAALAVRFGRYGDARRTIARALPAAVRASTVVSASLGGNAIVAELELMDGVAFVGDRRYADAEASFDRARKTMVAISKTSGLGATALLDRSIAERLTGRYREARLDLYAAHAMLGNVANARLATQLDATRAVLDLYARDDRDGAPAFAAAFDDLKRDYAATFAVLGERDRLAFAAQSGTLLDGYLTFALERPRLAGLGTAAFDVALFRKGIVARSIAALQARVQRSGDPAALRDFNDLVASKKELAALGARAPSSERAALAGPLERRGDALQASLAARFPDVASALASRATVTGDVRAALHPGDAAVEIVRFHRIANRDTTGPAWYAAVVLRADRPAPFLVELGSADAIEGAALASFRQNGIAPDGRRIPSDARALSKLVWAPIANAVVGARTVYLSADGALATIAFDALQNADGSLVADRADGKVVLLDTTSDLTVAALPPGANTALLFGDPQFDLSVADARVAVARMRGGGAPSATMLADASRTSDARLASIRSATDGAPLAPLAGSGDEVRDVARRLRAHRWDARTFTGADALEETFEAHVHGQRVIHLATHGLFLRDVDSSAAPAVLPQTGASRLVGAGSLGPADPPPLPDAVVGAPEDDPMLRSLLFFAGADRAWAARDAPPPDLDSGILTAAEASTLDLRGTELVVLSACETGLGSVRSGDGVIGLRRALRQAGARDVLISLWRLPDRETGELMGAFYAHWLDGAEAHDALRTAQREERAIVARRFGSADPYYWAGLAIVGPPSHV